MPYDLDQVNVLFYMEAFVLNFVGQLTENNKNVFYSFWTPKKCSHLKTKYKANSWCVLSENLDKLSIYRN